MTEPRYKLSDKAKEELEYECRQCGETEYPKVVAVEDPPNALSDYKITVECVSCGRQTQSVVYNKDIEVIDNE